MATKMIFSKATKSKSKLRLALIGVSGSGKTYTALRIAASLGKRVCLIDTEAGSASLYADAFEFDVLELATFSPLTYVDAIEAADAAGYDVIVIDSLSHAWTGKEGALEQVDKAALKNRGNSYVGWRDVTPMHNALIDAIIRSKAHVIATMRAKTEYVMEDDGRGKKVPRKIGMAPIQRDGMEYEFTLVAEIDLEHRFIVSKSRCSELDGAVVVKAGEDIGRKLLAWLETGEDRIVAPPVPVVSKARPVIDALNAAATEEELSALREALIVPTWPALSGPERKTVTELVAKTRARITLATAALAAQLREDDGGYLADDSSPEEATS